MRTTRPRVRDAVARSFPDATTIGRDDLGAVRV
jgi:hypothetical protein